MNGVDPLQPQSRPASRGSFLFGALVGFIAGFVFALVMMGFALGAVAKSSLLEDLASYRAPVKHAPVDDKQKEYALRQIERLMSKVGKDGAGFWDWVSVTSDIDGLVKDCELTAEEWPKFATALRDATQAMGLELEEPPARAEPTKGT